MLVEFECPQCKGHVCERWALNGSNLGIRLMYWHMILNPGIAVNELLLGQRVPAEAYVCKSCTVSLPDRTYVHCPGCGVFHHGRLWSYKNAFGNWLGYVCPSCGASIPCLWNVTSRVILFLTAPLWWLPVKQCRARWLSDQRKRISAGKNVYLEASTGNPKPVNYTRMGWIYGLVMVVFFTLAFPPLFLLSKGSLTWANLIAMMIPTAVGGLVVCPVAGWTFGNTMKQMLDKSGDKSLHLTFDSEGKASSTQDPPDSL